MEVAAHARRRDLGFVGTGLAAQMKSKTSGSIAYVGRDIPGLTHRPITDEIN